MDKKTYQKIWREKNKEKIRLAKKAWASTPEAKALHKARSKRYHAKKKAKVVLATAQKKYRSSEHGRFIITGHSASKRGFQFNISEAQYTELMKRPCYYCENPLSKTGIGLDRIDNCIGYELTNVLPCCKDCNRTRGDRYTVEETKAMINFIKEFRAKNGQNL